MSLEIKRKRFCEKIVQGVGKGRGYFEIHPKFIYSMDRHNGKYGYGICPKVKNICILGRNISEYTKGN